jgi:hypothetical protein
MTISLGVCPENSKHQITMVSASREGYLEFCGHCSKWRVKIDLKPIRAELREMGIDPDEGMLAPDPPARERVGEC